MNDKIKTCDAKIRLWEKMQDIVVTVENRTFSLINVGTILAGIAVVVGIPTDGIIPESVIILLAAIIPILILVGYFIASFNNRVSAIMRGYLAALEDTINEELGENVFMFNSGYSELYHGKFFFINDISGIMCAIPMIVIASLCYYLLYTKCYLYWHYIALCAYIIYFIVLMLAYTYDSYTNGHIKKIARLYFHERNKSSYTDYEDVNQLINLRVDMKKILVMDKQAKKSGRKK